MNTKPVRQMHQIQRLLWAALQISIVVSMPAMASTDSAPEGAFRTQGQNFKDMVMARCIARAYPSDSTTTKDARASANALMEWTRYDAERATDEIPKLLDSYLIRNYHNPLVEYSDTRFELLKCIDLYHSKALSALTSRLVSNPQRINAKTSGQ